MSTESSAKAATDDEPVPKLPRGRGMRFSGPQVVRIAFTLITLVGVMLLAKPCANAVSNFVMSYQDGSGSAMPKPGNVDMPATPEGYERLKPGMSEAEIKAAMERAKARQHGSAAGQGASQGSAAPQGASQGSAAGQGASHDSAAEHGASQGSAVHDPAPPPTTTAPSTTP